MSVFFLKELSEKSFDTNTGPAARVRPGELRATDGKWSYDTRPFIALLLNAAPLYSGRCILLTLHSPLSPSDSPPFVPQPSDLDKLRVWRALATQDRTVRYRWSETGNSEK